jgi:predicted RNA-binding Zn-ribbon protein involved in translation (DUF1610 family)
LPIEAQKNKGPWRHRVLVGVFTVLFSLLIFWLLDFAVGDIGNIPGPKREDVEKRFLSQDLINQRDDIDKQIGDIDRNISAERERQSLLRDSTSRYEATLTQLLGLQRANAQKGVSTGQGQQQALAQSVSLFLSNQQKDQALYEDILKLTEQQRQLNERRRGIEQRLDEQRKRANDELDRLQRLHARKLAALKLLLLLPLLAGSLLVIAKKRSGIYAPLVYGAGIAILAQTSLVIHECFPTRYFKYVLLSAAIFAVAYTLIWLLRMVRSPKLSLLLKQYRDAYEAFFCPVCDYPIRRGPRRFLFWTRRTVGKIVFPAEREQSNEETYSCPACGSRLFEQCTRCGGIRHSLLPYCEKCGSEKALAAQIS